MFCQNMTRLAVSIIPDVALVLAAVACTVEAERRETGWEIGPSERTKAFIARRSGSEPRRKVVFFRRNIPLACHSWDLVTLSRPDFIHKIQISPQAMGISDAAVGC